MEDYNKIPFNYLYGVTTVDIINVIKLEERVNYTPNHGLVVEYRFLDVKLNLAYELKPKNRYLALDLLNSDLDKDSDIYFAIRTEVVGDELPSTHDSIDLDLRFNLEMRRINKRPLPEWKDYIDAGKKTINFYSGISDKGHKWLRYELDFTNPFEVYFNKLE